MAIQASRLRIDLQEQERWRRTLNVTVPADLVTAERQKVASKLAKRVKLPGFRKGRIPAAVVEKRFGGAVYREVLDRVIEDAYKEALKSNELQPISEGEVEKVQYEPEHDLVFSISFDVEPRIELSRLSGFTVTRPSADSTSEDVERVLRRLREQGGTWQPVESGKPEKGDRVSVSVTRLGPDAEGVPRDYELVLGDGDAVEDVEEAIASLDPGASTEFTARLPGEDGDQEAEPQLMRIALKERKVRELPALDDEFARSLGDFEDLAALRGRVEEDLKREAETHADAVVRNRLLEQVVEANPFDVPRSMVERYLEAILGDTEGVDPERLEAARQQLRPEAEAAARRMLVLDRVAETQSLRATEAELDERIEKLAEQGGASAAEIYARLQRSGRLEAMEREITEQKVIAFLREHSTIEDET